MRVALFTSLFVVCFGYEAHQCGDNIGSCGAPRTSLMQVGSSNKRRMSLVSHSASRSGSRVSRALAGFEKYTNNLVGKYVTDKETIPMSQDVIDAIETVRVYIRGLFDSLNASHYTDKGRIESTCGHDATDNCKDLYFNADDVAALNSKNLLVQTARADHVNCRDGAFNGSCTRNAACDQYDNYRRDSDFAVPSTVANCAFEAGGEQLGDSFIDTEIEGKRTTMENCLRHFRDWFNPLWDLYIGCNRDGSTGEFNDCVEKQATFEEKVCQYNTGLNTTCHNYDVCIDEAVEDCNTLCDEVAILVGARKAENETGERILCLLDVLVDTSDEDKKNELDVCKKKTYNTSYFNLTCPGDVGLPKKEPPMSCTLDKLPCQEDFLIKYYVNGEGIGSDRIPYEAVCDCTTPCATLEGDHTNPVTWETNDFGVSTCPKLPSLEAKPPKRQCP